jgi:hypothetical protein
LGTAHQADVVSALVATEFDDCAIRITHDVVQRSDFNVRRGFGQLGSGRTKRDDEVRVTDAEALRVRRDNRDEPTVARVGSPIPYGVGHGLRPYHVSVRSTFRHVRRAFQ